MTDLLQQRVLGFCPQQYHANSDYLFVEVAAVQQPTSGRWVKVPNPTSSFPPRGSIYVPLELIPNSFEGQRNAVAAWTVADQPNWDEHGVSSRYRAIGTCIGPPEVIDVPCSSTDLDASRRLLLNDGVDHSGGVQGRDSLLRFADGVVCGPIRLLAKEGVINRFYCTESSLSDPLPGWSSSSISLCQASCNGIMRPLLDMESLPEASFYLDFASIDSMLQRMHLHGGIGGQQGGVVVDFRNLQRQIQGVIAAYPSTAVFNVRRQRLERLLNIASECQEAWIAWEKYFTEHITFRTFVDQAVEKLREQLVVNARVEIAARETTVITQIEQFEAQQREEEDRLDRIRHDVQQKELELVSLQHEVAQLTVELDRLQQKPTNLEVEVVQVPSPLENEHLGEEVSTAKHRKTWRAQKFDDAQPLQTSAQAITQLDKNFQQCGLLPASSSSLAREVFVAARLGQAIFFRGSFSLALAETTAAVLSGSLWYQMAVSSGTCDTIELPNCQLEGTTKAVVIDGCNRSCFDAYGTSIGRVLQRRTLGLRDESNCNPIVIGTLLDGPSCLPIDPNLISYGFSCNTDLLSWRGRRGSYPPIPGTCSLEVIDIEIQQVSIRIPEALSGRPMSILWQRNAISAAELLLAIDERHAYPSIACGWVIPYLASLGIRELPEEILDLAPELITDNRVIRHLVANEFKVPQ